MISSVRRLGSGFSNGFHKSLDTATPTPRAKTYGIISFTAVKDNPTIVIKMGNHNNTIFLPDGQGVPPSAMTAGVTVTMSAGDEGTITCSNYTNFGLTIDPQPNEITNIKFLAECISPSQSLIDLANTGATGTLESKITIRSVPNTLDLRGCAMSGVYPPNTRLDVGIHLYIGGNNFTGALPNCPQGIATYQVQSNGFRGDIPDISGFLSVQSFLCYNQDDGFGFIKPNDIRVMLTGTIPDLSGCPNLKFYHVGAGPAWQEGFKNDLSVAPDFDVNVRLDKFFASNCQLSTEDVDLLLSKFAAKAGTFINPVTFDISGTNGYPSATGLADAQTLEANGWTVNLPALK
jgi:hypothetical protein